MSGVEFEDREVRLLSEDFMAAAAAAPKETRAIVQKGALQIKTGARRRTAGIKHVPALGNAITYDSHETPAKIWAEIGPEQDRRGGNLAHFVENEYGTPWSAPQPIMAPEAEAEAPRFERAMQDLADRVLER